jgi:glyoxylase-like metal-dependent hydrolase (beta-lactamase superfamily II)
MALCAFPAGAQAGSASIAAPWDPGAADCKAHPRPPIERRAYDAKTYVFRESLCSTFEGPFIYLLIGSKRALLIDTGDVADPRRMPLASAVFDTLRGAGASALPLLVAHTHRHADHRAGDAQFLGRPNVEVVPYDLDGVRRSYGFAHWPEGRARLDLGGRAVDVVPTPGHEATHLAFYDTQDHLLFTGDLLLPGRLLIDDAAADRASARRLAAFVGDKPVAAALGGHIEMDRSGRLFDWGSTFHPDERPLPMTKAEVLALPAVLDRFNGVYTRSGSVVMMNSVRVLALEAAAALGVLAALAIAVVSAVRSRRKRRASPGRGGAGRLDAAAEPRRST